MYKLRDYQINLSIKGAEILKQLNIVYLSMQVRCGKTATALDICKLNNYNKVLFLTKKKAIDNIKSDYNDFSYKFYMDVINNESLHLIKDNDYDCIVMDEAHRLGSYPKPCKMAKDLKKRFADKPFIFLSGTPTPESYSQIYHQFWISNRSPFKMYVNFYKWCKTFVKVKQKYVSYGLCNDYSDANKAIIDTFIDKYMVTYTQDEAGFTSVINEHVLHCEMSEETHQICRRLRKDLVVQGKVEVILADTPVKLMQKLHQLYSGTVKFESGNSMIMDDSKGLFIKNKFKGKKIAIFYKFKEELNLLKSCYGDNLTTDLNEFNTTDKNIALQIISGREGISLKAADYLVYLNIDFSATSYWQSRDRLTTMERKTNDIFFIFAKGGIEEKIFDAVMKKRNYTLSHFKQDYANSTSKVK
jgi:hypothetical protein